MAVPVLTHNAEYPIFWIMLDTNGVAHIGKIFAGLGKLCLLVGKCIFSDDKHLVATAGLEYDSFDILGIGRCTHITVAGRWCVVFPTRNWRCVGRDLNWCRRMRRSIGTRWRACGSRRGFAIVRLLYICTIIAKSFCIGERGENWT